MLCRISQELKVETISLSWSYGRLKDIYLRWVALTTSGDKKSNKAADKSYYSDSQKDGQKNDCGDQWVALLNTLNITRKVFQRIWIANIYNIHVIIRLHTLLTSNKMTRFELNEMGIYKWDERLRSRKNLIILALSH